MSSPDRSRATAFGSIRESLLDESGAFPIAIGRLSEAPLPPVGDPYDAASMAIEAIEELPAESVSLIPEPPRSVRPVSTRPPERAKLVIEDLSLWPDNPYLPSSLIPPPAKPFAYRKAALIVGAMLLAAGVGGITQWAIMAREARNQPVARVAVWNKVEPPRAAGTPVAAPESTLVAAGTLAAVVEQVSAQAVEKTVEPVVEKAAVTAAKKAVEPVAETAAPATVMPAPAKLAKVEPVAGALPATAEATASAPAASEVVAAPAAQAPAELEAVATTVELPEMPTRDQVTAGFESVRAAVAECAAGQHGLVTIQASIASSGRVAQALVEGAFRGTPVGSCIARAVRTAKFPAFSQARLSVSYPFAL